MRTEANTARKKRSLKVFDEGRTDHAEPCRKIVVVFSPRVEPMGSRSEEKIVKDPFTQEVPFVDSQCS